MSMILDGSLGVTFNDASLQGAAASPYVLKNRIINGDMVIDQRNAGASVNANSVTAPYVTDRFNVNVGGSSAVIACQQVSDAPANFVNSLRLTVSTVATPSSSQYLFIRQIVEGFNIADLGWGTANARTVTLSFWVKASIAGTYSAFAINGAESRSYVATFTVSATNTWEYKTITIPGDTTGTWLTNNSNGIRLGFDLGSGSDLNGTANAWQAGWKQRTSGTVNWIGTNGATFYITGVQLEQNTSATPFERRLYGQELANCQRYYFKVAPGSGGYLTETAFAISTTGAYGANKFPVTMRTAPASLEQSGTAGDYRIVRCGAAGSTTCSAVPTFATATVDRAFTSFAVSSGLSNSSAGAMDAAGANAFLAWSAEL
jgi:hypothetical protein